MRTSGIYQALPDGAYGSSKLLPPQATVRVPSPTQATVRVPTVQQAGSMSTPLVQLSGGNAQKTVTPSISMSSLQSGVPTSPLGGSPLGSNRVVATSSSSLTAPVFVPVPRQYSGQSHDLAVDPPRLGSSYRLTTPPMAPTVIPPNSASHAESQPGVIYPWTRSEDLPGVNSQIISVLYSCGSPRSANDMDGKSAPVSPLSLASTRSISVTDQFNQRIQKVQQGELGAATAVYSPSKKDVASVQLAKEDGSWLKSVQDGCNRDLGGVMEDRALKEAANKTFREDKSQIVSDKVIPQYDSSTSSSAVTTTPRDTSALSSRSLTSSLNSSLAISPTRLKSEGSTPQTPLSICSTNTQQSRKVGRSSSVPTRSDSPWTYPADKHSTPTSARDSKPHADRFKKYLSPRRGSTDKRVDAAAQRQELLKLVGEDDADGSSSVAQSSVFAQSRAKNVAAGGRFETLYQDALERHRRFHERVSKFLEQTDDEINGAGERTRQQVAKNQKRVPGKSQHGKSKSPGLLARKEKRCSQVLEDAQLKELKEDAECSFQPTLITSGTSGSRRDSTKALVLTTSDSDSDLGTPRSKGGSKGGTKRINRSKSAGSESSSLGLCRIDSKASYESQSLSQVRRGFSSSSQMSGVSSVYEDEQQTPRQVLRPKTDFFTSFSEQR